MKWNFDNGKERWGCLYRERGQLKTSGGESIGQDGQMPVLQAGHWLSDSSFSSYWLITHPPNSTISV